MMKVNVYTVGKNCIKYLERFIDHYSQAFDDVTIYYFDNHSTDGSYEYAIQRGLVVDMFEEYSEYTLRDFKNTVWKSHPADWHIVCDVDEFLEISQSDIESQSDDVNIIKGKGWQVYDKDESLFFRAPLYDKCIMFRDNVREINYSIGAHMVIPQNPVYSKKTYIIKHFGYRVFDEDEDLDKLRATQAANIHRLYTLHTEDIKVSYIYMYDRVSMRYISGGEKLVKL